MQYVTTNIRLRPEVFRALKVKAAQEDKSLAELVRQALSRTYGLPERSGSVSRGSGRRRDPLYSLSGICRTGIRDGSVHHDRDIYRLK